MGKVLIIKNADFTENSIENTWQKVSQTAMPNGLYHYYIDGSTGAYTQSEYQCAYYIQVEAGTLLKIKFAKKPDDNTILMQRCGFYQAMPSDGSVSPLFYVNKDPDTNTNIAEHVMVAPFNGIFIISRSVTYVNTAKEEIFIKQNNL